MGRINEPINRSVDIQPFRPRVINPTKLSLTVSVAVLYNEKGFFPIYFLQKNEALNSMD